MARNLVAGQVPTPDGPRQGYVFDHEQAGRVSSVLAAVQVARPLPAAVELRLPSAPLPDDAGLDLLEPVGERYAFVSDAEAVRPLLTSRLADAADVIGDDVELVWAEDAWVLGTRARRTRPPPACRICWPTSPRSPRPSSRAFGRATAPTAEVAAVESPAAS